jgi:hypothetical protein
LRSDSWLFCGQSIFQILSNSSTQTRRGDDIFSALFFPRLNAYIGRATRKGGYGDKWPS